MNPLKLSLIGLFALLLAACAVQPAPTSTPTSPPTPTPHPLADILDTHWILVDTRDGPPPSEVVTTLNIGQESFTGKAVCNHYNYRYKLRPDGSWWYPLREVTVEKCGRWEKVENRYLSLLGASSRHQRQGEKLAFLNDEGEALLRFRMQPAFALDPETLTAHPWQLAESDGIPADKVGAFVIRFEGNSILGATICRNFTITFQRDGDRLTATRLDMGKSSHPCTAKERDLENAFIDGLLGDKRYETTDNQLVIHAPDGTPLMRFIPAPQ